MFRYFAVAIAATFTASAAHAICGDDADGMCEIETGNYHIELPENPENAPVLMFLHGWGSSGEGSLTMRGMVETALAEGYAVLAPNGIPRRGRDGLTWNFFNNPDLRDEVEFLTAVRDDAAERFGVDGGRVMLAGFSIGGSMTSYVACRAPEAFAHYAPISGNVWRPHPETCAGPVRMLHTHGWTDTVVPLEGRILGGAGGGIDPEEPDVFVQGDVWVAMQLWRVTNGCQHNNKAFERNDTYWIRTWADCSPGAQISMALHYGGHSIPPGWTEMAIEWAEGRGS